MELVEQLAGDQALDFEKLLPTPAHLLEERTAGLRGLPGWYEWRREHWGVKWNAEGVRRRGYGRTGRVRYRFHTPYCAPIEFLDHVASLWPDVTMELTFDVEQMGGGAVSWSAGEVDAA
jgi:hypothetical protein